MSRNVPINIGKGDASRLSPEILEILRNGEGRNQDPTKPTTKTRKVKQHRRGAEHNANREGPLAANITPGKKINGGREGPTPHSTSQKKNGWVEGFIPASWCHAKCLKRST